METKRKGAQKSGFHHLLVVGWLEKVNEFAQQRLTETLLQFCTKWLSRLGHYGLMSAAALGFLLAAVYAIRFNTFTPFLLGLVWVLLVFVVQYTAVKFADAGATLIDSNPTSLSSKAFLDCLAFLSMIGGIVVLVVMTIQAIQSNAIYPFLIGLGIFVLLELLALLAYHPALVTVSVVRETTAGQEAIGIVTFFLKGLLKLVPIFFGVGVLIATVLLLIDFFKIFGEEYQAAMAWSGANVKAGQILYAGLLPFLSYIVFVLLYLVVDLIQAILSIPGKLDRLNKNK